LGAKKPNVLNRIANIVDGYRCLREIYLGFNNTCNYMIKSETFVIPTTTLTDSC